MSSANIAAHPEMTTSPYTGTITESEGMFIGGIANGKEKWSLIAGGVDGKDRGQCYNHHKLLQMREAERPAEAKPSSSARSRHGKRPPGA